jgi:hypothetical protein
MGTEQSRRAMRAGRRIFAMLPGAAAALLLACALAGCTTTNSQNVSLVTGPAAANTVAFESIDGPPPGVFSRLVANLSTEAEARQMAVVSREGAASYRVRGYLAAQIIKGRTSIAWVWDVYDVDRQRALRITGEEAGGSGGRDPWGVADEQMLRRIARASMDRLVAFLGNPDAIPESGPATAVAEAPEPAPPAQKRRNGRAAGLTAPAALALAE